jgi:hypothetical protein
MTSLHHAAKYLSQSSSYSSVFNLYHIFHNLNTVLHVLNPYLPEQQHAYTIMPLASTSKQVITLPYLALLSTFAIPVLANGDGDNPDPVSGADTTAPPSLSFFALLFAIAAVVATATWMAA